MVQNNSKIRILLSNIVLLPLLFIQSCDDSTETISLPQYNAEYSINDCPIDITSDYSVECGTLTVPETRRFADNGKIIKLAVLKIKSESTAGNEPMFYLHGGPGGRALSIFDYIASNFETILTDRDLILFDQRGSGFSEPSLKCPEVDTATIYSLQNELGNRDTNIQYFTAVDNCKNRLLNDNVSIPSYNTLENIEDVNDLRKTLQLEKINLYGASYGTRLALLYLNKYPGFVSSAVIDGVLPPQSPIVNENAVLALENNISKIFDLCESQTSCNERYPNLKERFWSEISRLNANNASYQFVVSEHSIDTTQTFSGRDFLSFIQYLMETDRVNKIPQYAHDIMNEDYSRIISYEISLLDPSDFSLGKLLSADCADDTRTNDIKAALSGKTFHEEILEQKQGSQVGLSFNCDFWEFDPEQGISSSPVQSQVSVLVLNGEYDVRTPPAQGDLAAETLSNASIITVPQEGHVVFDNQCAMSISSAFFDSPSSTLDTSCISEVADLTFDIIDTISKPTKPNFFDPRENKLFLAPLLN